MKKKNKDFEYTPENYSENVFKHGNSFFTKQMEHTDKDFDKIVGKVRPLNNTLHTGGGSDSVVDSTIIGKTIDFYWFDEDNGLWFMGFTDGTFIFREQRDHNMMYSSHEIHQPQMQWGDGFWLHNYMCVAEGDLYSISGMNDAPKITPIGRWIEEHTDLDVIGYYQTLMERYKDNKQRQSDYQREKDLKEYNRLKEKLGL